MGTNLPRPVPEAWRYSPSAIISFQLCRRWQDDACQAKPSQAKPSQAKPSQAKPSQAKPSQAKPNQAKPSQAKPSQTKPNQTKPCQGKARQGKARQGKARQGKASAKRQASRRLGGDRRSRDLPDIAYNGRRAACRAPPVVPMHRHMLCATPVPGRSGQVRAGRGRVASVPQPLRRCGSGISSMDA